MAMESNTTKGKEHFLVLCLKRRKEDAAVEVEDEDEEEDPILSRCRKGRRRIEEDPIQIDIEKLPDALLFEVLYRLPCRSALQYKSVSKRWCSVISSPEFVRRSIHHHHHHHHRHQFSKSDSDPDPFTLVLQYDRNILDRNILALPFHDSEDCGDCDYDDDGDGDGNSGSYGDDFLSFLPSIVRSRKGYTFSILASFNDLLLVYSEVPPGLSRFRDLGPPCSEYCICNPLTKQWTTLPRLPYRRSNVLVGFVCNPYSCDKEQGCITNAHYSYKVLRIRSPTQSNASQLHMQIFSSDTGEWCDSLVSSARGLNPFKLLSGRAGVVNCNGMLHWVDEHDSIVKGFVVFDPFNDAQQCRYINPPTDFDPYDVCLGVFQGHFRIFNMIYDHNFSVWELEDYCNAGTWRLIHKVYFKDMVSEHSELVKMARGIALPVLFLAFHPRDSEIVFLQFCNHIVFCNMRTRVLKMAGHLRHRGKILPASYFGDVASKFVFILEQPSWPTPVLPSC